MMKKFYTITSILLIIAILGLVLEGKDSTKQNETILVGVSPSPHGQILEHAKKMMKKEGYNLKIKVINDYTTPNRLLNEGELDANFFQHTPYLNIEKKSKKYKISSIGNVHLEPMAVYSNKYSSLKDLPEGAEIYVSNNPAEEGRFLSFFTKAGLIELKSGVDPITATFKDIKVNKKNFKFNNKQSAEFLPKSFKNDEGDATIINSNFAIDNKLNPVKDSIAVEGKDSPYANLIAVREEDKNSKKLKALIKVLQSKEMQDYINKKYDGAVIAAK